MEVTSVIIKPRITEKCQIIKGFKDPKMAFVVNLKANKYQVANAFESLFGISPKSVNILRRKPVPTRFMNKSRNNYTKAMKIAYVTVSSEDYSDLQKKTEEMIASSSEANNSPDESTSEVEVTEDPKE